MKQLKNNKVKYSPLSSAGIYVFLSMLQLINDNPDNQPVLLHYLDKIFVWLRQKMK